MPTPNERIDSHEDLIKGIQMQLSALSEAAEALMAEVFADVVPAVSDSGSDADDDDDAADEDQTE